MERPELAALLAAAGDAERAVLLERSARLADAGLAYALKGLYDDTKISDPRRAAGAAAALSALAACTADPAVHALAAWTAGMAAVQLDGQPERALVLIDTAATKFAALGQPLTAAATQLTRIYALALLGRYDEAIACGLAARDVLLAGSDPAAAGKVEQNLGNLYARRDQYQEAEHFYRAARTRFAAAGDQQQLAQVDIGLANVLALQGQFRTAATLYAGALGHAQSAGQAVMEAAIECNLGCLALFQGRYNEALDYLERSRRRYARLGMPHKSAQAERELADAYLELNLAAEAATTYERVIPQCAALGMRAEQAWALAHYGRALLLLGRPAEARAALTEAHALYRDEGNTVGEASAMLAEAYACYTEGDYVTAAALATGAEAPLAAAGARGRLLLARWLHGEVTRAAGQEATARTLLEAVLRDAQEEAAPQVAQRCHTSLGLLAAAQGDPTGAEASFREAVAVIEQLRAPLPAEEFRTAFVADKLVPYHELVRLCLEDGTAGRVVEALSYVERARSRALLDMLGSVVRFPPRRQAHDPFEAELLARLEELREELNWFYSQINRSQDADPARSAGAGCLQAAFAAVREREAVILEITRQLQQRGGHGLIQAEPPDIARLQRDLGADTALVEYYSLDDEVLAFVVTDEGVEVIRHLGTESQVAGLLERLRFQLGAFGNGPDPLRPHLKQLAERTRRHLEELYGFLLGPIEGRLEARRLVVVPHRALHYVPFHALHNGAGYLIERREVCYVPSAGVLQHCLTAPRRPPGRGLLLGVPDVRTPRVRDEVDALVPLFPEPVTLRDDEATLPALREQAPTADVVHLACHGQFRPDNPLFSAIRLADGWLTVHDAYGLDLHCQLVTLSACETGVSLVAPGDELLGLARGFLSAGAPSLLLSLWTVDDASTARLMTGFYSRLRAGDRPAAALRQAQRDLLAELPHPYFWSPFLLLGRW